MASTTTNLNLVKPATTDAALISDINGNMDIIDAAVGALQEATTDLVTLSRTFYASATSCSCACTTNQKTFLVWCSSGSAGGIMDSAKGGLFLVSNGQYAQIHKGSAVSASVASSTFTLTCTSSVAMGVIEL